MALSQFRSQRKSELLSYIEVSALTGFWRSVDDKIIFAHTFKLSPKGKMLADVKFSKGEEVLFEVTCTVHDLVTGIQFSEEPKDGFSLRSDSDGFSEALAIAEGMTGPEEKLKLVVLNKMKTTLEVFIREQSYAVLCSIITGSAISGRHPAVFLSVISGVCPKRKLTKLREVRTKQGKLISYYQLFDGDKPISNEFVATYPIFITESSSAGEKEKNASVKPWEFAHAIFSFKEWTPSAALISSLMLKKK